MSDAVNRYKARLERNGLNLGEAYNNNTIAFIESAFASSPTYRLLDVASYEQPEITEMDARIVEVERMGTLKEILFRPTSEGLNIGAYVTFDEETYLIFDKYGKDKAMAEVCNRTLKWKDKTGNIIELNCVASSQDLGSKAKQSKNELEWNKYDVTLPLGQLFVFVELRPETASIKLGQRFIFGGSRVFRVEGIDDTTMVSKKGHGILQFTVKVDTVKDEDDFVNRVAHNVYEDVSEITPTTSNPETGQGGRIW